MHGDYSMDTEEVKTSKVAIRKCPYCGESLPPLTKVCPSCGQIVEDEEDNSDVTTIMENIDTVCAKFSKAAIRFYDYLLLLIPVVYLVWFIVAIYKIVNSNRLYNDFISLCSKAQTLYGANHQFRNYLSKKTIEVEELKRKNRTSHIILYIIMFVDVLLLAFSLSN